MSYPLRVRTIVCCDCKKPFKTTVANAKRCPDCKDWNGKPIKKTQVTKETA